MQIISKTEADRIKEDPAMQCFLDIGELFVKSSPSPSKTL
jgi:hypothetical protein